MKFYFDICIQKNIKQFFIIEKTYFEKYFFKKNLNFWKKICWDFFQLKCHLKSIFQKSILNDISIEKNIKICFFENWDFFWKIFFKFDFLHDKKQIEIFFGYLYRCKISCSFGLWGFQSDPGTANHSLEPGTMLVPKMFFFGLNAVSGPSGRWIIRLKSEEKVETFDKSDVDLLPWGDLDPPPRGGVGGRSETLDLSDFCEKTLDLSDFGEKTLENSGLKR